MNIQLIFPTSPGPVYTPIQVDTREAEEMEDFGAKSTIGRPGQPSEVATSFVFLASVDSSLFCMSLRWLKLGRHCLDRILTFSRWASDALLSPGRLDADIGT